MDDDSPDLDDAFLFSPVLTDHGDVFSGTVDDWLDVKGFSVGFDDGTDPDVIQAALDHPGGSTPGGGVPALINDIKHTRAPLADFFDERRWRRATPWRDAQIMRDGYVVRPSFYSGGFLIFYRIESVTGVYRMWCMSPLGGGFNDMYRSKLSLLLYLLGTGRFEHGRCRGLWDVG